MYIPAYGSESLVGLAALSGPGPADADADENAWVVQMACCICAPGLFGISLGSAELSGPSAAWHQIARSGWGWGCGGGKWDDDGALVISSESEAMLSRHSG